LINGGSLPEDSVKNNCGLLVLISVLLMVAFSFFKVSLFLLVTVALFCQPLDYSLLCPVGVIGGVMFVWSIVSRFSICTVLLLLVLLLLMMMQNLTSTHGKSSVFQVL